MANGFTHFIYNILQDSYIILRHSIFLMNPILFLVYKFRKCSLVADKRLRNGLKAQ